jgi:hypothetical protein
MSAQDSRENASESTFRLWVGRDVSAKPRYYNMNLGARPFRKWPSRQALRALRTGAEFKLNYSIASKVRAAGFGSRRQICQYPAKRLQKMEGFSA